jgi:ABC-type Fe3+ transport system permease subunit
MLIDMTDAHVHNNNNNNPPTPQRALPRVLWVIAVVCVFVISGLLSLLAVLRAFQLTLSGEVYDGASRTLADLTFFTGLAAPFVVTVAAVCAVLLRRRSARVSVFVLLALYVPVWWAVTELLA